MPLKLPAIRSEAPRQPLKRWQLLFGHYLMAEPKTPSKALQCEVATRLANDKRPAGSEPVSVTYQQLKDLKGRGDFQEYCQRLAFGGVEAARALLVNDMPLYMEMHRWATETARLKNDYRAMAPLTVPVIDRVLPKREGANVALEQHIHINLSPKQASLLDTERPVIEADVIAIEPSE